MKTRKLVKFSIVSLFAGLLGGALLAPQSAWALGRPDLCNDHCAKHDKCRVHDKAHKTCAPKPDKCKSHDRCKPHDKCRQHDKAHAKCPPKVDPCKNHSHCAHNKCRQHDRAHAKCPPKAPPVQATTFSGRATAVYLTNSHQGPATILIGDTGPLPRTGGSIQLDVAGTNVVDALTLDMAHVMTSGSGNASVSEVTIQEFEIAFAATNGVEHTLSFDSLQVTASAECSTSGVVTVTSTVNITGLLLDGASVTVSGEANQVISFDGGSITINAQSSSVSGKYGKITVAGIHLHLDGCMDGSIGLAHADIRCGTRAPGAQCSDRVTGGGFIFDTPSGERANFGVGGGIQNGRLWGHLNYKDHGTGMHVKATSVTGYEVVDATTRMITYNVTIDGAAGTATVLVTDAGEPGRDDLFAIQLSTGYEASGDLGGSGSGGGNIQLHKSKCR